jgi:signal transduction histidine kinase
VDHLTIAQALAGRPVFTAASLGGTRYRVLVVPFQKGADPRALVVATSLARSEHAIRNLLLALLAAGAVGLVLAAGSGWWLARRALQPVARMTEEAGLIGAGRGPTERIQVPKAADELARLAETLNGMLARLEQAVTQQRRFVADVSQELRTPLTVMRSEIDVSLASDALSGDARSVLESTREEAQRMTGIVENLLTLARIDEEELHLIRRPCDLRKLAEATARELGPIAGPRGVTIRLTGNRGPRRGRSRTPRAGDTEPARQRNQVLAPGRYCQHHSRKPPRAGRTRGPRRGTWDRTPRAGARVRTLLPGKPIPPPRWGGKRAGARDLPGDR